MAYVPVLNTAMFELRYLIEGQRCENTLYFSRSAPWAAAGLSSIAGGLRDWWNANIKPNVNAALTLVEVYATDLASQNGPTASVPVAPPSAGAVSGDYLPNNCSLAISFRTALRGRAYRGRNYAIGISELSTTGNSVTTTFANAMSAAYTALFTFASNNSLTWVVVSRTLNGAPRVSGAATPITGVLIPDLTVDSQRRRLPGRGK